jgi:hypothetical protein
VIHEGPKKKKKKKKKKKGFFFFSFRFPLTISCCEMDRIRQIVSCCGYGPPIELGARITGALLLAFFVANGLGWENAMASKMLGIVLMMGCYWMTEVIPVAATSLLPAILLPLTGIANPDETAKSYFGDNIFLFVGSFIIGLAMEKHQLHNRLALKLILATGDRPTALLFGLLSVTLLVSLVMSNTSTTAVVAPLVMSIVRQASTLTSDSTSDSPSHSPSDSLSDSLSDSPSHSMFGSPSDSTYPSHSISTSHSTSTPPLEIEIHRGQLRLQPFRKRERFRSPREEIEVSLDDPDSDSDHHRLAPLQKTTSPGSPHDISDSDDMDQQQPTPIDHQLSEGTEDNGQINNDDVEEQVIEIIEGDEEERKEEETKEEERKEPRMGRARLAVAILEMSSVQKVMMAQMKST